MWKAVWVPTPKHRLCDDHEKEVENHFHATVEFTHWFRETCLRPDGGTALVPGVQSASVVVSYLRSPSVRRALRINIPLDQLSASLRSIRGTSSWPWRRSSWPRGELTCPPILHVIVSSSVHVIVQPAVSLQSLDVTMPLPSLLKLSIL